MNSYAESVVAKEIEIPDFKADSSYDFDMESVNVTDEIVCFYGKNKLDNSLTKGAVIVFNIKEQKLLWSKIINPDSDYQFNEIDSCTFIEPPI